MARAGLLLSGQGPHGLLAVFAARTGPTPRRAAWLQPVSALPPRRLSATSSRRLFEAAKDGILILDVDTGRINDVNPFLFNLNFDTLKDLDPVMLIGTAPNVLATHPSRPFKSFADVVAAAKAKPGTITYASIGSGSVGHLTIIGAFSPALKLIAPVVDDVDRFVRRHSGPRTQSRQEAAR